jgi:hypothetical protein
LNSSRSYPALAPSGATRSPARTAVGSPAGAGLVVVDVAVGFVVVVGRVELVAVVPEVAVTDGPEVVVLVDSAAVSPSEGVLSPSATAVATVVVVVLVCAVRPACSAGFEPSEEAPATPTHTRAATALSAHQRRLLVFGRVEAYSAVGTGHAATQMRICAQRGRLRKRSQRLMSDGKGQA